MIKFLLIVSLVSLSAVSKALPTEVADRGKILINICPDGKDPDADGVCRPTSEEILEKFCEGAVEDGICQLNLACPDGDCDKVKKIQKREAGNEETTTEATTKKKGRSRKADKRSKRNEGGAARSKHFIIMLKKKKAQMMKPKPPPPPPPPHHHHPPHHPQSGEAPPEEEQPAEEEEATPAPERLFFGDELCLPGSNTTADCRADAEMVAEVDANKEFKEWKPQESEQSSDSSSSSSSSSSSDSDGESASESEAGSGESDDEVLEKALKIKLMKFFEMKQRYGPALRRWLVDRLREYENSFN